MDYLRIKIFTLAALLLMVTQTAWAKWSVWDGTTKTSPNTVLQVGGTSSKDKWLNIYSAAELAYICENWNKTSANLSTQRYFYKWHYKLMVDIDMGDWSWTPLGTESYEGSFDGNGHTIRINISGATNNYQGLFASIASGGRVHNLHVSGNIQCSTSRLVGGIAGENNGTISNCWVSADVSSNWRESWSAYTAKVGGIAGENNGTVEYCCMTGNVANNDADVGGLVGDNSGATVSHCTFYGSVSTTHSQSSIYVGDDGSETGVYNHYESSEVTDGKGVYNNSIQNPYAINISNVGEGTYVAKIGETTVTRARPGQNVKLTKTLGTVDAITIKDRDGNTISSTGDMTDHLDFTMPHRDVNVTATFAYVEPPTYTATFTTNSGGDGWTVDPTAAISKDQRIDGGTTVTVKYTGPHKVKSVTMKKLALCSLSEVTSEHSGMVIGADGNVYANAAQANMTTTALAVIAYVGSETGVNAPYNHGLAIALTDESGMMNWQTATNTCTGKTPTVDGGTWCLPSTSQWQTMFGANGDNNESWLGLNEAIIKAGGTTLQVNSKSYWTSSYPDSYARVMFLLNNTDHQAALEQAEATDETVYVRACLAF